MRWPAKDDGWRQSFAWFPVTIGDVVIWLEPYWRCPGGDYDQVSFFDPRGNP